MEESNSIFENVSEFSKQDVFDIQKKAFYKGYIITILVFIVILSAIGTYFFLIDDIYWGIIMFASAFICLFLPLTTKRTLKNIINKMPLIGDNTRNFFYFYENHFKIISKNGDEEIGSNTIKYNILNKISDTEKYMLLYISKTKYFAMSKTGMLNGTFSEINDFLKNKVQNYKVANTDASFNSKEIEELLKEIEEINEEDNSQKNNEN